MKIQLSDHFTYKRIFLFTISSIIMMVFSSIYGIVDGLFVSNFVGKDAFAAVNFIYPFILILGTVGFMLGTGGSALVAKTLGEEKKEKANQLFSMFVYVSIISGIIIAIAGILTIRPITAFLGAEGELLENSVKYGRILLLGLPFYMLQIEFQSFYVTAEKPHLGLVITVISGVTNMVLDALLIAVFKLGIQGAAIATIASQILGSTISLIYFASKNKSLLKLSKPKFDGKSLLKACTNGSSELMSNISMNLVGMLYNIQLLKYVGEDGVSAYGVLMYVCMIFLAIFIGFSIGIAPIIGYNHGSQNHDELKNVYKKSMMIIIVSSVVMVVLSLVFTNPLAKLFVGYDDALFNLTKRAFYIFSFSYLFSGLAIFGSSFFTALNNGLISALISFLRTLVFQIAAVFLLPLVFDVDGIWLSVVVAELMAAVFSLIFLIVKRKTNSLISILNILQNQVHVPETGAYHNNVVFTNF